MVGSWTFDAYLVVNVIVLCGAFIYWLWKEFKSV